MYFGQFVSPPCWTQCSNLCFFFFFFQRVLGSVTAVSFVQSLDIFIFGLTPSLRLWVTYRPATVLNDKLNYKHLGHTTVSSDSVNNGPCPHGEPLFNW